MNKKGFILLSVAVFYFFGMSLMLYPTVSNLINRDRNNRIISSYRDSLQETEQDELSSMLAEADEYNRAHVRNYIRDAFSDDEGDLPEEAYDGLLNGQNDGVMGYLDIPSIKETLAIYHGTDEDVLEKGIGHIEGTSLPVGGMGTHSVLAGHRGLPSAKLFTDLDQLEVGDIFFVHVLDRTMAYRVDQILIVEPDETEALRIEDDKDLVTLLTCTPYGVNTKRLLVRGQRTSYDESIAAASQDPTAGDTSYLRIQAISLTVLSALLAVTMCIERFRRRKG